MKILVKWVDIKQKVDIENQTLHLKKQNLLLKGYITYVDRDKQIKYLYSDISHEIYGLWPINFFLNS